MGLGILKQSLFVFRQFFFDPVSVMRRWMSIPSFVMNLRQYRRLQHDDFFSFRLRDLYFSTHDRFGDAATVDRHYFHQDIWAAKLIYGSGVRNHVDIGSRVDGFVAHLLLFCTVTYVDIRPLSVITESLRYSEGSVLDLPFADNSVHSLSCLHVIEHIGLGRYGDQVNPQGHELAARELRRVLKPGGMLLVSTPVGRERLCFDAHRVFDPSTVIGMFFDLNLVEFSLIPDAEGRIIQNAPIELARSCEYGCGLFRFTKK
jgi:SAM-dependent methyltransferase